MANYTHLDIFTANELLKSYFSYPIIKLTPFGHGISNTNYLAEFKNHASIILKISNDKNITQLNEEEEILKALKFIQYPYSILPIKDQNNNTFFKFENQFGVIYPYLHGFVAKINEQTCYQVGSALGHLHSQFEKNKNILDKLDISYRPKIRKYENIGQDFSKIYSFIQEEQSKDHSPFRDFVEIFNQIFTKEISKSIQLINSSLPQGIIHGDLYYDNVLFNNNMEILGVLDFEQAGLGPFLLDMGISISGTCLKNHILDENFINEFLEGYKLERELTPLEEKYLGLFIVIGLFSIALWRIFRFDLGQIDKTRKNSYQELIKKALNFYENFSSNQKYFSLN